MAVNRTRSGRRDVERRPPASPSRVGARRPGRPRGPSQAAQLRERLVNEASQLYARGGFTGLSFGLLAQRTGISKATIFHYFPNKDALVYAIFSGLGARLNAVAEGWFDPPPASYARRLDRVVEGLVDFYGRDPVNAAIVCHGLLEAEHIVAPPSATSDGPVFRRFVGRFLRFLEQGMAAEAFHPERPLATMMAIGGAVLFEFLLSDRGRLLYSAPVLADERAREITAFVHRAVVRRAKRLRGT